MIKKVLFCFLLFFVGLNPEISGRNIYEQAQWKEYISSFTPIIPPYYWASYKFKPKESRNVIHVNKNIFSEGNVFNTGKEIAKVFHQFIPEGVDARNSKLYFGAKYQRDSTYITIVFQGGKDKGKAEKILLIVYNDNGEIIDWKIIRDAEYSIGTGLLLDEWVWEKGYYDSPEKIGAEGFVTVTDTIVTKSDKDSLYTIPISYNYYIGNSGMIRQGNSFIGKEYSRVNVKGGNMVYSIGGTKDDCPLRFTHIEKAYKDYLDEKNNKDKALSFFEAFPARWKEIAELYSFTPDDRLSLYSAARGIEHIKGLRMVEGMIPDSTYVKKIMQAVVGGDDTPSLYSINSELHKVISRLLHTKGNTCFEILRSMGRDNQFDFWRYYVMTTLGYSMEFISLEKDYRKTFPEEIEIMKTALSYYDNRTPIIQ